MATNVSTTQMSGLYKKVYADGILVLVPENAKLYKEVGALKESERVGDKYNEPVVLQMEQGYTYGGSDGDAFAIGTPVAMLMDYAELEGSEGLLASRISYRAAAKAVGSEKAFKKTMSVVLESHMRTHAMRRELEMWYGRSATGLATSSATTNVDATHETLTITPASWAPGIWAGQEGCTLNAFNTSGGALISSGADAIFTLQIVNTDDKKLTLTGTSTGITALGAVETVYLDFASARATMTTTHKCFEGIDYAVTLAAGNDLWGINTNYTLWKGNSYAVGGALNIGKVLRGVELPVGKAGLDEAVDLWVNPSTWSNLSDSLTGARSFDSSYSTSEGKNGVEKIIYHGSNGAINVRIHPVIKGGEAFAFPTKRVSKIGSTDITMNTPGRASEDIFLQLASNAGFEFRTYSDFALFTDAIAKFVKFTGIVNS